MRGRRVGAVLGALSLSVLAGCSGSSDGDELQIGPDGTISSWAPGKGPELPALRGTTLDGTPLDVAAWKGDVVVINVWGSWCTPCREEAPVLVDAAQGAGEDVHFVGVDVQEKGNLAAARTFEKKYAIPYPSLDDDDGKHSLTLRSITIGGGVPPQTLVVGRDGRLVGRIASKVDASTLRGLLQDAGASTDAGTTGTPAPSAS